MAGCTHNKIQNPPEFEQEEEVQEEEEPLFQSQDSNSSEPSVVVGNHFSMLRLDHDTTFKSSTTTTNGSSSASASVPSSTSISNSIPMKTLKRRSPSDSPPIYPPNPKKEKLSLPPPHPLLRRCISDPFNSTAPPANTVTELTPPASTSNNIKSKPTFRRSVSDPNPCPSPARKTISLASSSSSSGEDGDDDNTSPSSKRLRRIKNRVREMSRWFQKVMLDDEDHQEEEQHLEPQEDHHQPNGATPTDQDLIYNPNSASATDQLQLEDDREKKFEESVGVERMEESLVIHFRCQCGLPYKFLLAGGNCYYKLM